MRTTVVMLCILFLSSSGVAAQDRQLLWGDTHLHTTYSVDAFLNNNLTVDPDTAYRFAKGEPVIHPYHRARIQLEAPLDFLVVSDHAEFLGGMRDIYHNGLQDEGAGIWDSIANWFFTYAVRSEIDARKGPELFLELLPNSADPRVIAALPVNMADFPIPPDPKRERFAWEELVATAEAHYEPGEFTTLMGWEWSALPGGANLHRVVVTDADADQALTFQPFSALQSPYPEDLWQWLDRTSAGSGARFLAIPHNSNVSKGLMFTDTTLRGLPVDEEYARERMRWERIVEVTQIKGDSEAHLVLSPEDEFAGFEPFPFYLQRDVQEYVPRSGDYVRSALMTGLQLEAKVGINPFQFGLIGSTDSHAGLSTADENNFAGKMATDSTPETSRWAALGAAVTGWHMSASGLAAVWAEDNTREAILGAMLRRETYATTGPRIRVRFYGGWDLSAEDLQAGERGSPAPARLVPMGGEIPSTDGGDAPTFLVVAAKDPAGANLDRVQIVKGWLDAQGEAREQVFDVVWSGDRQPGVDGRLPVVGNTVDTRTARYDNSIGAAELAVVWRDPAFAAEHSAFYYVRVLEIPTPRHSLYDALALGMEAPDVGPSVIQERAYTSPIWYHPPASKKLAH